MLIQIVVYEENGCVIEVEAFTNPFDAQDSKREWEANNLELCNELDDPSRKYQASIYPTEVLI